jgi:DNA polymerase-3 subunit chi
MSEVLFYHLERQTLEQALPLLLEATLKRGWKAVVQAGSEERMQALDSHLWTFKDEAFLPHAAKGDARFTETAASQPIWLTHEDETPNEANVLFLVDGAERDAIDGFERTVFMFDGRDDDNVARARARWAALQDAGHELTYWQQSAEGKWEQKA